MSDITLLNPVISSTGQRGRLYYYKGNFFYPLFMRKKEQQRVEKAIRLFKYKHRDLILSDRKDPGYKPIDKL